MKSIFVEVVYRIIATAKGHQLVAPAPILVEHELKVALPADLSAVAKNKIFFAQLNASIRAQAVDAFVKRLKTETDLKRFIGGTKWAVELVGDVIEFPIYLQREQVGTIAKLIDTRNPYKITDQIVTRNFSLVHQICVEMQTEQTLPA